MTVSELIIAILAWFSAQNNASWWECGKKYTPQETQTRAAEYAKIIYTAGEEYPAPGIKEKITAMIAQESAFDECNIAGWAKRKKIIKKGKEKRLLPRKPTKEAVLEVLRNRGKYGLRKVDTGPLQRIFPPYGSIQYGPEQAIDLKFQVELTAQRLPVYLKTCEGLYGKNRTWRLKWTITKKNGQKKVIKGKHQLTCQDMYFTLHNTGGMSVNTKYYKSVSFQWRRWRKVIPKTLAMK